MSKRPLSPYKNGTNTSRNVLKSENESRSKNIDPKWRGKTLAVVFREPLKSVLKSMQPRLHSKYIAVPSGKSTGTTSARMHYVITLENNKPLIVYPHEFEIIGEAQSSNNTVSESVSSLYLTKQQNNIDKK